MPRRAQVQGHGRHLFTQDMPIAKDDIGAAILQKMSVWIVGRGIDVLPFINHGVGTRGGSLKVVDLGGIGEQRQVGGTLNFADFDRRRAGRR